MNELDKKGKTRQNKITNELRHMHAIDRLKEEEKKVKDYFVLTAFLQIVIDFDRGRHISNKISRKIILYNFSSNI
jgi:hypothetical protein